MIKIEPGQVTGVSSELLDMTKVPDDDQECFRRLNELDVFGIFQFETDVAIGIIKEIGIDSFADMYAATTLGRPDPLSGNLHLTYGRRKRGIERWESIPVVADILDQSYGLPIYQESSMALAQRLAGFTGAEANALRKGLAKGKDNEATMKKLQKLLAEFRERSQKSVEDGLVSQEQLDDYIETLKNFGGYGFNKSHAASYAMVAYWSLWLKTHFPVQFMVALLNFTDMTKKDKRGNSVLKKYIQYAKKLGVIIAPPDINTSEDSFTLEGNMIRWGLGMIKNLGKAGANEVVSKRPFESFPDFCNKVEKRKCNKSKVMALIKSGAFDCFGDREFLINQYLGEIRKEKAYEYVHFDQSERKQAEEELLGMPLSFSLIPDHVYEKIGEYGISRIEELKDTEEGVFLGVIGKIKKTASKKSGNPMWIVEFADDFNDISFFVWEKHFEDLEKKLITGHIMTVPLRKFDIDSDGCFYSGKSKHLLDLSEDDE
jgi:DNA polymerase-3 subunit alpha